VAEGWIVLELAGLTLDHPAAQAATVELLTDLRGEPNLRTRQQDRAAESGAKGAATEIIVSLATSGSLASLARILQVWLSRDRRRSLTVALRETPDGKVISVEGEKITADVLAAAIKSVAPPVHEQNSKAKKQPKQQH
jgi:hypothetical protein